MSLSRMASPPEAIHAIQVPKGPRLSVTDLPLANLSYSKHAVVISLLDPGTVLDWQHPRHQVFWVDDVEHAWRSFPSKAFLDALLNVDLAGAATVLIHCHGGFSRSPAAAMLWARKLGTGLRAIERGIDWDRADPNRLILALGEDRLGLGRSLRDMAYRRTGRRDPSYLPGVED